MGKFFNNKISYIFIVIALSIVIFVLLLKDCSSGNNILASISPTDPVIGEEVFFADSTAGAKTWLWEFGDSQTSDQRSGQHTFTRKGTYKVRLKVNNHKIRYFDIRVKEKNSSSIEHLVQIIAPTEAIQGENIVFRGEGNDEQWRWEFGESGIIDSREKTTIYAYNKPGEYEVLLTTENTRYPIRHNINILPYYSENDSTDIMILIGLDIKEKLQNIVDGKPFNTNYNYVINKYFENNPNTLVIINNDKYNDFYSYCQGLRHIGRKETIIQTVVVETENDQNERISQITVIQTEKKK